TAEDDRQRLVSEQTLRSLNGPSLTEIWSGKALNDIVADLRRTTLRTEPSATPAAPLPLDENALKHINVTSMRGLVNVGLLKNEGGWRFRPALSGEDLQAERERVTALVQKSVQQAKGGELVDAGAIFQLNRDIDQMQQVLRKKGKDLPPNFYMEARTFLNNLADAVRGLGQKNIGNYFNGKYALKTGTVPDLLAQLSQL